MSNIDWYQFKLFLERASGVSMDALHMLAGFTIFLVAAPIVRKTLASGWPLLILFLLEMANEAYDLRVERWPDLGMQLGEAAKHILLTMPLPALITAIARWAPGLIRSPKTPEGT